MDMSGMEVMAMYPSPTQSTDMSGMPAMNSVATTSSTPTLLASTTSEMAHSDGAAGQMGSMASMSGMSNAFHFGIGDTLWTSSLTPTNSQGYAGAIILLVLMALFQRFLITLRGMAETRWNPKQPSRCNGDETDNYLKMGQTREDEAVVGSGHRWNTTIQLTRALFQLTTMTVVYLL